MNDAGIEPRGDKNSLLFLSALKYFVLNESIEINGFCVLLLCGTPVVCRLQAQPVLCITFKVALETQGRISRAASLNVRYVQGNRQGTKAETMDLM